MVVMLSLGETRAGDFFAANQLESGQIAAVTLESTSDFYGASEYDASGYAVAPNSIAGSGPASGVLEVSNLTKSTKAFQNYKPGQSIEFVFDPKTNRFVVGKAAGKGSPHQNLAGTIGGDANVVGGMFKRGPDGKIMTNEFSGHFHQNWTPQIREQMKAHLEKLTGQTVDHFPGM